MERALVTARMFAKDIGGSGQDLGDLGDLRILLSVVPGATNRGWLGYCTVVLFPMENGWGLFDTGHHSVRHLLLFALRTLDIQPNDIRHVVLSHLHFDHSLNLPLFKNVQVYISHAELDYARKVSTGEAQDVSIPDFWPALLENHRVHIVDDVFRLSPDRDRRRPHGLRLSHTTGHTGPYTAVHAVLPNA